MPSPAAPARRRVAPSLSRLALAAWVSFTLLVLGVTATILFVSVSLDDSWEVVTRETRSRAIASELELSLLTYQRLSNLYLLTGEPDLERARDELASRMHHQLVEVDHLAGSDQELRELEEVSRGLMAYLELRDTLEGQKLALEEVVPRTRGALNETLSQLAELQVLNEAQVDAASSQVARIQVLTLAAAGAVGLSLFLGLLATALGLRRYVLRPVLELHECVSRVRRGESGVRVPAEGVRELADLGRGFNEMADALARQREEQLAFLAGVAHDLRNPLSGVKIGIQVLGREGDDEGQALVRTTMVRQVDRLARMIDDLLDATRIQAGNLELRPERFDLREIVEEAQKLYAPTAPEHQVRIELPQAPVIVDADPMRIEQVIGNLLTNAFKFSPAHSPVCLRLAVVDGAAEISVIDRGMGIAAEELDTIFLPFRRRKLDVTPGVGLGLSVVRRLVDAHGGAILVQSEPGVGSTFRVRLPLDGPEIRSAAVLS